MEEHIHGATYKINLRYNNLISSSPPPLGLLISPRRNKISHIQFDDRRLVTSHDEKSLAFYTTYKNRMDSTYGHQILIDLQSLITSVEGLDILSTLPTKEEMNGKPCHLIEHLDLPGGYNGLFLKNCWHIISEDYYCLQMFFFQSRMLMQCRTWTNLILLYCP